MSDLIYALHDDMPRQGPGDAGSTRRAWELLRALPPAPRVLDLGCGPGAQSLDLAYLTRGTIQAVDNHLPYLAELRRRARRAGVRRRVHPLCADLEQLPLAPASFDVLWAEAAIYAVGFARALRRWRPLLKPGGYVAVSEVSWLRPEPPAPPRAFWRQAYPGMQDVQANLADLEAAGYERVGYFVLPESAWWEEYYHPLQRRLGAFARRQRGPEAADLVDATRAEIELYRTYARYYGCVFYVGRRTA
ncbi:MAG: class I SAM-dependent methyltransferase [Acidobacteria bacterium]|nr:MAG: class I SAM-dependent methyltransferase [Acidobacteriota bacterium]